MAHLPRNAAYSGVEGKLSDCVWVSFRLLSPNFGDSSPILREIVSMTFATVCTGYSNFFMLSNSCL